MTDNERSDRARLRAIAVRRDARARPRSRFFAGRARRGGGASTGPPRDAEEPTRDLRDAALVLDRQRRLARSRSAVGRRGAAAAATSRCSWPSPTSTRRCRKGSPIDRHAALNTTSVYTPARDLPDAARAAVDRPHVAQRGRGSPGGRHRDVVVAPDGDARSVGRLRRAGAQPREARLQRASARG